MYSVGRFSKLTGINTKTLVWFDKVGLIKPEKVNFENGYRYYGEESLKKAAEIQFWRSMDFSVNEMTNLSKEVISKKIEELHKKIDLINMNINLLEKIKEEDMENISIFEIGEKLVQGKWSYQKTSTDFKDVLDEVSNCKKEKYLPDYLFFGERNFGTDLKDVFGYTNDCFSLSSQNGVVKDFWFFVVNHNFTLVLYEKPKEDEKKSNKIKFHIYSRRNSTLYTTKEIQYIFDKHQPIIGAKYYEFNKNFVGKWKMFDEINESEISKYDGKIREKDACFTLSPLFDILQIYEDKSVDIMEEGEELELNKTKIFNRSNTKLSISMGKTSKEEFDINNMLINKKHHGLYKKIGNEEFLFVNIDNDPDLDEKVYVYKKEN